MLLITGASGTLGGEFARLLPDALTPTHQQLDVTNRDVVLSYVREKRVHTVIHCAALTSVRLCETNRAHAFGTNVSGTRNLVDALSRFAPKPYFIYVSTACVFPGDEPARFYSEDDIPYPCNFYGLTKLLGEYEARRLPGSLIIRTNFAGRGKWKYPSAFTDRFGTYLYVDEVARAITKLIHADTRGCVHVCGDRSMSMYDFARIGTPDVKPMILKDYLGPPVTVNMCLTSNRIPPVCFTAASE